MIHDLTANGKVTVGAYESFNAEDYELLGSTTDYTTSDIGTLQCKTVSSPFGPYLNLVHAVGSVAVASLKTADIQAWAVWDLCEPMELNPMGGQGALEEQPGGRDGRDRRRGKRRIRA